MVVRPEQRERAPGASGEALEALAQAGAALAGAGTLAEALRTIADAVGRAAGAEIAVIRVLDDDGEHLTACAVSSTSAAVAAELEGTRFPLAEVPAGEVDDIDALPPAVARAARRVRATATLQLPVGVGDDVEGTLELLRTGVRFG